MKLLLSLALISSLITTLGGCFSKEARPSIASLEKDDVKFEEPAVIVIEQKQVIEKYRDVIVSTPSGEVHSEAMRRLADLELETGEANILSDDLGLISDGNQKMYSAIELYKNNLKVYPNREWNDLLLYQLAKAYNLAGEPHLALQTMTQLVNKYSDTRYYDEVQFRRGELLFVMREYPAAAEAYLDVVTNFKNSLYYEKALYKLGWARFKQEKYDLAVDSYIALLDIKMRHGLILEQRLSEGLSRADRELLSDALRVVSLSFSYQDGAESIKKYFIKNRDRGYEALLYRQLGELYLSKDRIIDAANVYLSYVSRYSENHLAPQLHEDAIKAYKKGDFPALILSAKENFVERYGVNSRFWMAQNEVTRAQVKPLLMHHIKELAEHYHTISRKTKRTSDYQRAANWYKSYLNSFPDDQDAPRMNFMLAESLHDARQYSGAVQEYENSAYNYPVHAKSAESGYAALLTYDLLIRHADAKKTGLLKQRLIASGLRFSDHFPQDKRVPSVLTKTSEALYKQEKYQQASETARRLLNTGVTDKKLLKTAWIVYGHSQFEMNEYRNSENAYSNALKLTIRKGKQYKRLSERLAASIYKQGEKLKDQGDHAGAAAQFVRVGKVVPASTLRAVAQYDAATIYIQIGSWQRASNILEDFRLRFPKEKKLQRGVTEKLAVAYIQTGHNLKAAREMLALASIPGDKKYQRNMMLQAAETYDKAQNRKKAASTYKAYLKKYPQPVANAIEAQQYLADYYHATSQVRKRDYWLKKLIKTDKASGKERSNRSRYLAASASLILAESSRKSYLKVKLTIPLKRSLKKKKKLMKKIIKLYENTIKYNVSDVTTAATYHIGQVYSNFASSLMKSERPKKLSDDEREQYDILLEEQAYPFEEKSIEIHKINLKRTHAGIYDGWIKKSLKVLAELIPARYAKIEKTVSYVEATH